MHSKGIKDGIAYNARFCYDVCEDYYGNNNITLFPNNMHHCCQADDCNGQMAPSSTANYIKSLIFINYFMGVAFYLFYQ